MTIRPARDSTRLSAPKPIRAIEPAARPAATATAISRTCQVTPSQASRRALETTRRLRAALEIFEPCFPSKHYRQALAEVKRLANALGERRDRDVAIASLHGF